MVAVRAGVQSLTLPHGKGMPGKGMPVVTSQRCSPATSPLSSLSAPSACDMSTCIARQACRLGGCVRGLREVGAMSTCIALSSANQAATSWLSAKGGLAFSALATNAS